MRGLVTGAFSTSPESCTNLASEFFWHANLDSMPKIPKIDKVCKCVCVFYLFYVIYLRQSPALFGSSARTHVKWALGHLLKCRNVFQSKSKVYNILMCIISFIMSFKGFYDFCV